MMSANKVQVSAETPDVCRSPRTSDAYFPLLFGPSLKIQAEHRQSPPAKAVQVSDDV